MPNQSADGDGGSGLTATPGSLIERAKGGDEAAWVKLVELFSPLVLIWCKQSKFGLTDHEAEDVGGDIFAAVYTSCQNWQRDENRGSFRRWLRRITQRKLVDFYRQKLRQPTPEGGTDHQKRMQQVSDVDALGEENPRSVSQERLLLYRRAVKLIVDEFPEHYLKIFWQVCVDGRPRRELAEIFEMKIDSIHKIVSRIKKLVRERFEELLRE